MRPLALCPALRDGKGRETSATSGVRQQRIGNRLRSFVWNREVTSPQFRAGKSSTIPLAKGNVSGSEGEMKIKRRTNGSGPQS